jgi:hypothetical protein
VQWIEAVQLGGADEAVERRGTMAAGVGAHEEVIFASDGDSPDILPMSVRN